MKQVKGFKVFDKTFKARNGCFFEEGKIYKYDGGIIPQKKGFHFAKRLEDTLRYSNSDIEDVIISEVTGIGNVIEFSDEYFGYYDLYVTDKISIDRVLSREEIIDYICALEDDDRICRFIACMKLNPKEIRLFLDRSIKVLKTIEYYQFGNKKAFRENSFLPEWKEVKRYGKYYNKRCTRK